MRGPALSASIAAAALAASAPAWAHGLLVQARGEGSAITGRVYYSDGTPGAGEFVQLRDLAAPAEPLPSATTDPQGNFRFPGVAGRRYAVIAHGEEGHTTEVQLTLAPGERARLVEAPAAAAEAPAGLQLPPAWLLIGGALLLSTLPALWLKRRRR